MSEHQDLLELAALLPLGTLSPEDEARIDAHLRGGCGECEAAVRASAAVVDALALTVEALEPTPELRARLLTRAAEAGASRAVPPPAPLRALIAPRRARLAVAVALAASLALAVGLGLEVRELRGALGAARESVAGLEAALADASGERARLAAELAAAAAERSGLEGRLADAERTLSGLTSRETRTVALAGTDQAPAAAARAFLDPETRRLVLVVYELPPPPPGRSYQLWVIVGGEPTSAGVFDVDPAGRTRYETAEVPAIEGAVTIAVTVEPAGGLPKPSGPLVLAGS
jgi:anti-sigma-K factor RskA